MGADQKQMLQLVMTRHAPYGLHAVLPKQSVYVTVLREPWARVVSDYFYLGQDRGHSFYGRFQSGASLAEFVR